MTETDYSGLVLRDLNYQSYLQIPELLRLQRLVSRPRHHDEMFFIVIHQSFELWFKEMLHETDLLVEHFRGVQVSRALKVIKRINAILENLTQQIQLLSTLTPVEFAGFRDRLKPASGFQSLQFREIEFAYGLRDPFFLQFFKDEPEALERLRQRLEAPSVYDEFLRALAAEGLPVPAEVLQRDFRRPHALSAELVEVIRKAYVEPGERYHWVLVFEAMLDLDMLFSKWRAVHVLMVTRTIGGQKGTGGSSGVAFLESRLPHRFFPELWEVRNVLFDGGYA